MTRPRLEVADVVQQYGEAYLARYGHSTSAAQHRVLRAIAMCRTAALGGHSKKCDQCGHIESSFNSCRNRHCPKCQGSAQAAWVEARQREVLDVPYFHVIFTLPDTLNALVLNNPRTLHTLLFRTVAETLLTIARDPGHLGADIGFLAILHTWGQQLQYHPHLHCVVPGGGLARDGTRWVSCPKRFFLPVRVLSRFFRRRFLEKLEWASTQQALTFSGTCEELARPEAWQHLIKTLRQHEWVVYAKRPFDKPESVLKYLARYTHRVAISNRRLLALERDKVIFRWKDYKRGNHKRTLKLDAVEFIRRFLLHVLPRGFQRIRYGGFLANCVRREKLNQCRQLLRQTVSIPTSNEESVHDKAVELVPSIPEICPMCQLGQLVVVDTTFPHRAMWDLWVPVPVFDSS